MKRAMQAVFLAMFAVEALVVGQGAEVTRVLGEIRAALGGAAKLAAVKSMSVDGRTTRVAQDGSSVDQNFEMAFELPAGAIKFVKKDVIATMGGVTINRRSGFNGNDLIDDTDMPPSMSGGGNMRVVRMGPGGPMSGPATPEQKQEQLTSSKREFARLVLGMLGDTTAAYPVAFTYGGQVDAAGGKAEVLELKAVDGFSGKLYIDGKTHLPLMLSWMDKEPLRMSVGGGNAVAVGGGAGQVRTFGNAGSGAMTPDDIAKLQADMAARMKEAEANRRTVEFRMYYADYKPVDGVKLPARIQRMMDGTPTDELNLDKIVVNAKIDPAKFAIAK